MAHDADLDTRLEVLFACCGRGHIVERSVINHPGSVRGSDSLA